MHREKTGFTASRLASSSRRARRLGIVAALVALALASVQGTATASAPLRVCPTCAYTDISAALAAAAQSGDKTIRIEAGSYPGTFTVSTNVSLVGAGAGQTTVGGVIVDAGVSVTIKGVTITNVSGGPDDRGVRNAGDLTLKDSVVTDNVGRRRGHLQPEHGHCDPAGQHRDSQFRGPWQRRRHLQPWQCDPAG